MHEMGVVTETLARICEESAAHGGAAVATIEIDIPAACGIEPDHFIFDFDMVKKGTAAEHAKVNVRAVESRAVCQSCDFGFGLMEFPALCPFCGSAQVRLAPGQSILLKRIVLETTPSM